jgi:hypothetical protein
MPVAFIAASVVGSVSSAAISSSATKKAVAAQRDATAANNALAREQYANNSANLSPDITRGKTAGSYVDALLGIGGDPAASAKAFDTFRDSTGYKFQLSEGLNAVNSNAYARGMGDSGATLKALQERGNNIAAQSAQSYIGNLQNISEQGTGAASALAGVGAQYVNQVSGNNQNLADAIGNGAMSRANSTNGAIQNLINAGAYAYGSSYAPKTPQMLPPAARLPMTQTPYGYMYGGFGRST